MNGFFRRKWERCRERWKAFLMAFRTHHLFESYNQSGVGTARLSTVIMCGRARVRIGMGTLYRSLFLLFKKEKEIERSRRNGTALGTVQERFNA